VFIANDWTETSPRTVTVFSNCDEVKLYLNGQWITAQKPDTSARSRFLLHPPFVFENLDWKPGELKAVGFIRNREAASDVRNTPGKPKFIDLRFDRPEPALADGEEMFFVYASMLDSNGAVVRNVKKNVHFQIRGPGVLISPESVETEAGTATALIQTAGESGDIFITAKTDDIGEATVVKKVIHATSH
jgi:beta-galactosidase